MRSGTPNDLDVLTAMSGGVGGAGRRDGEVIRHARKRRPITMRGLAARLGLSVETMGEIERGERRLPAHLWRPVVEMLLEVP